MSRCTDPLTLVTDNAVQSHNDDNDDNDDSDDDSDNYCHQDLGWGSSRHELAAICPKLMDGLACINGFTVRSDIVLCRDNGISNVKCIAGV